jgi:glyoxylase-like metal-dependent hydrolase (beta-lactamase superfamily II)
MIEEIRPNLYRIEIPLPNSPLKYLNSYVIRSDDRHLIVDTGLNRKECLQAMQAGLKELDIELAKTDFFITHLHADHFGLVNTLVHSTSKIFFNRPETDIIEAKFSWDPMLAYARQNGFPKNELQLALESHPGYQFESEWVPDLNVLHEGDEVQVGQYQFQCVSTPGHSMGHMCLYEPAQKILIAGDHILVDITPNIQCWSSSVNPLKNYLFSLDKVSQLDIDLTLPGHRRIITDHMARIKELKEHHHRRLNEVVSILKNGPQHGFQIASQMTWDLRADSWEDFPRAQKWFAFGEALAHLRYLEEQGTIRPEAQNDITHFALAEAQ